MRSLIFCFGMAAFGRGLVWNDLGDGRLELRENGTPYLVYNSGPQLKEGVPEDRRRCCYVFPVYTPGGVSMLDDFPRDHYHHRGLFWGWPVVETGEGKYDLWLVKGVGHRLEKIVAMKGGTLEVSNGWYAGERRIVAETVRIAAGRTEGASRRFTVALTLTALDGPVTLRGSQEKGKSYGGFSARFAPREGTVMRSSEGAVSKDEDLVRHAWAEMEAAYGGRRAVLRITPEPGNPGAPYEWCLRNYGFVGASFPGQSPGFTLQPGKPLRLSFAVTVRDVN